MAKIGMVQVKRFNQCVIRKYRMQQRLFPSEVVKHTTSKKEQIRF